MRPGCSSDADRIGFGRRVDGASKLLIDSALFLELRQRGVSCSLMARCLSAPMSVSVRTQRPPVLICGSHSPSRLHIIKIIPQPSTNSLFVTRPARLSSVKVFTNYSPRYNGLFKGSQPLTGVERVICESLFKPPVENAIPEECK